MWLEFAFVFLTSDLEMLYLNFLFLAKLGKKKFAKNNIDFSMSDFRQYIFQKSPRYSSLTLSVFQSLYILGFQIFNIQYKNN